MGQEWKASLAECAKVCFASWYSVSTAWGQAVCFPAWSSVSQCGAVFLSVEQCVEHFPREPWEDRMPGAACAPALALLCPTLFVPPIVLLSSLWVLWYTLYKTSPVFAFKVHTGQVWVFWDQSINGQCRRRGHLRRRWPEAESHRGTLGPPGARKVTAELCCASKCPYCCVFKTVKVKCCVPTNVCAGGIWLRLNLKTAKKHFVLHVHGPGIGTVGIGNTRIFSLEKTSSQNWKLFLTHLTIEIILLLPKILLILCDGFNALCFNCLHWASSSVTSDPIPLLWGGRNQRATSSSVSYLFLSSMPS